jgi:hypothetical protein
LVTLVDSMLVVVWELCYFLLWLCTGW